MGSCPNGSKEGYQIAAVPRKEVHTMGSNASNDDSKYAFHICCGHRGPELGALFTLFPWLSILDSERTDEEKMRKTEYGKVKD